jgi:hypothetical protein
VKLTRVSIQIPKVVALFRCLSFITEFVEDSFDVTVGFSVLKKWPGGLRDFSGIFLVRGGWPAGFCVVFGVRELGEGRLG